MGRLKCELGDRGHVSIWLMHSVIHASCLSINKQENNVYSTGFHCYLVSPLDGSNYRLTKMNFLHYNMFTSIPHHIYSTSLSFRIISESDLTDGVFRSACLAFETPFATITLKLLCSRFSRKCICIS